MLNENNIILLTDSYKVTHWKQYPPNTEEIYSYFESRGGKFQNVIFFGLQYYLLKYFAGCVVTREKIEEAEEILKGHFGSNYLFNKSGWEYILDKHDGHLPIEICAVPEGTKVPTRNVLVTSRNTDEKLAEKCPWLTNYLESLLVQTWYPTTVATISHHIRQIVKKNLAKTGGDPTSIDFKLHDFGFRGVSSVESAGIGGAAHLLNFNGTDTLQALVIAKNYYKADQMPGFSIPAAEHSTITAWGKDNEVEAYKNMLQQYPNGLVAVVSDSYDIYNACRNLWGGELKDEVLSRNGALVIRPDSGYPPNVIVNCLEILGDKFGTTKNEKGFKLLNPKVRLIQGDGIDLEMIEAIYKIMHQYEWCSDNVAFGMGGALLQRLDRDTQSMAFKCSSRKINGKYSDVYKNPITDMEKSSKGGKLSLICDPTDHKLKTVRFASSSYPDILQTVFYNGKLTSYQNFDDIKYRCRSNA